jgi:MFS family permease
MTTFQVFRAVLRGRDLRRVELAYVGFNVSEYAVWIGMLVYAYQRGGTTQASLIAVLQLVPAALCAPFLGMLGDRHPVARVLALGYVAQAAGMGLTAAAMAADAPVAIVYAGAVFAATAVTVTRPAQAVLMPSLARSPEELTAANVVSSWVETTGGLIAGLVTGAALTIADAGLVFGLMAGVVILSAGLVYGVPSPAPTPGEGESSTTEEALAGFRAVRNHPHLRPLVGLLFALSVLVGAVDVLFVVVAIDLLSLDQAWAGYLNAAWAAGGVVGGLVAVVLVGRRYLSRPIGLGIVVCGLSFVIVGIWPSTAAAVILFLLADVGRTVVDVAARTLLQRTTSADVLGRVFGLLEGATMAALAVGALLVPPLVHLGGAEAALIGIGLLLPLVGAMIARPLLAVDRGARVPVVEIALLRSMPLFAALPAPALEGVARALEPLELPAGTMVIRTGDEGDRFYAIASGEVEVRQDGEVVAELGRGGALGEIALLGEIPRTADVVALTDLRLYALEKEPFLTAVTGHAPTRRAAAALVSQRHPASTQPACAAKGRELPAPDLAVVDNDPQA